MLICVHPLAAASARRAVEVGEGHVSRVSVPFNVELQTLVNAHIIRRIRMPPRISGENTIQHQRRIRRGPVETSVDVKGSAAVARVILTAIPLSGRVTPANTPEPSGSTNVRIK